MKKYSKIYKDGTNKNYGIRYNYELSQLESIAKEDFVYNETKKEYETVVFDNWKVYDSIGLSLESWQENPKYWVETYKEEKEEELKYLYDELKYLL